MTVAICLQCGSYKHGAWSSCPACGYKPDDDESMTRHKLVTDHFLSHQELKAVSERIKAGDHIEFPSETLERCRVSKADIERKINEMMLLTQAPRANEAETEEQSVLNAGDGWLRRVFRKLFRS